MLLEEQKNKLRKLSNCLPELTSLFDKYASGTEMTVYEGVDGFITASEDTLTAQSEMLAWTNISFLVQHPAIKAYAPEYSRKKRERKIKSRCIFSYTKLGVEYKKNQKRDLREIYFLPEETYPFRNEIDIYDDKVCILSQADLVGVIIQNSHLVEMMRSLFQITFDFAKQIEPTILTPEDAEYLKDC